MEPLIFVVEDDENIQEIIKCTLSSFGFAHCAFESGEAMFSALEKQTPSLFLLDVMLPGIDGFTILAKLREQKKTKDIPVIMLTAKAGEVDKVKALDGGADDYIAKPFSVLELTARIRAVLRRSKQDTADILENKDLIINKSRHEVYRNGQKIELTLKEYDLLLLLMENANRVVTREEILSAIWDINFQGETRTLDMHIKSLRAKLGDNSEDPLYIKTVRGVGYTMV